MPPSTVSNSHTPSIPIDKISRLHCQHDGGPPATSWPFTALTWTRSSASGLIPRCLCTARVLVFQDRHASRIARCSACSQILPQSRRHVGLPSQSSLGDPL